MNKKLWKLSGMLMIFFIGLISVNATRVYGEEKPKTGFYATVVVPENQQTDNSNYFNLLMKPNQEQEIGILLTNPTSDDVTVNIDVNTAVTNRNGNVDYSWNLENAKLKIEEHNRVTTYIKKDMKSVAYDSTLLYPISEIIQSEPEVTIPANSELTYKMKIKMPEKQFDGFLLGGIHLSQKIKEEAAENKGVQITNRYAFEIALKISETDVKVTPNLKLDKNKIVATSIDRRNYVTANLQNTESTLMRDLSVEAKVYRKGSKKVYRETSSEKLQMSPNSNFDYEIPWGNHKLEPGKYTLVLHAKNQAKGKDTEEKNQEWNFTEDFEIKKAEAKEINKVAIELEDEKMPTWIYWVIGGLICLLLLLSVVVIRLARKKK